MKNLKKYLGISALIIAIMIVLLLLLSIGEATNIKKTFTMIVIIATLVALFIIWLKYYNDAKGAESIEEEEERVVAHTGSQCEIAGLYQCTEHEARQVNMKKGRRFPPCKGDTKGHSCDWKLMKKHKE